MSPPRTTPEVRGRPATPSLIRFLFPAALALLLAWLARAYVVEPEAIAHACDPTPWAGACAARSLVIRSFSTGGLGWVALAAGGLALALRHPAVAGLAWAARWRRFAATTGLAAGAAGLVLYCFEPSAVGALLAALAACASPSAPGRPGRLQPP